MSSKKLAVIALFFVILLGGAGFGLYTWKMNSASFRGIGVDVQGQPKELIEEWEGLLQEAVVREDVLNWVLDEGKYADTMNVPAEGALEDLKNRIKVTYKRNKSSIEVGLTGKRKEDEKLAGLASELYRAAASVVARQDERFAEFLASKKRQ